MSHYNIDAEQSLLGMLMHDYGVFEAVQPLCKDHFYEGVHKVIFSAIAQLVSKKKRPDPLMILNIVKDELDDLMRDEMSGENYVRALYDSVFSTKNAESHASIIRDKAKERELLAFSEDVKGIVSQSITVDEKQEACNNLLEAITKKNIKKMPRRIQDIAIQRTAYYESLQEGNEPTGWATYIQQLDNALTGGLKSAKLVILAARPGVGKSSFSWQITNTIASQGHTALFLSMEMPEEEIADRAVSNMGRVDYQSLLTGRMSDDDWTRASEALEEMGHRPLYVDDQPALTISDIRAKARSIPNLKLLVVDYLQLCSGFGTNRNAQIEEISRGLKGLSKELDICVIALSQLNREAADGRPKLHHLRDSGAIEQDADVVIFLWEADNFHDGRKLIGLGIDKNRQGKKIDFALNFDGNIQRWEESERKLYQKQSVQVNTKGFTPSWND